MKKIKLLLVLLFFLFTTEVFSQSNKMAVIQLKNGYTVKGVVIEEIPNQYIKIKMKDGSILEYKMDEIESINYKIEKENKPAKPKKKYDYSLGLSTGINSLFMTDISKNELIAGKKLAPGYNISISYNLKLSKRLSFQTEGIFENRNIILKSNLINFNQKVQLDYLTFPIGLCHKFGKKKNYFTSLGYYTSVLTSQNSLNGDAGFSIIKMRVNSTNMDNGIYFTLGSEFSLKPKTTLTIQVKSNYGLAKQNLNVPNFDLMYSSGFENTINIYNDNYSAYARTFSLNVGIKHFINNKF